MYRITSNTFQYLPNDSVPRESRGTVNRTGSCLLGFWTSTVVHAILWEEPQATRVIFTSSNPWTKAGFLLTVVVPLPCWPWSLSPQAYTWNAK